MLCALLVCAFALAGPPARDQAALANNSGVAAYLRGDYGSAESDYREALRLAGSDNELRAKVHSNLAALYKRRTQYQEAAAHYYSAAELLRGSAPEALAINNAGEVHRLRGESAQSIRFFRRALALLESRLSPPKSDLAAVLNNLGVALGEQGRFTEAFRHLERALALKRRLYAEDHREVELTKSNLHSLLQDVEREYPLRPTVDIMQLRRGWPHRR